MTSLPDPTPPSLPGTLPTSHPYEEDWGHRGSLEVPVVPAGPRCPVRPGGPGHHSLTLTRLTPHSRHGTLSRLRDLLHLRQPLLNQGGEGILLLKGREVSLGVPTDQRPRYDLGSLSSTHCLSVHRSTERVVGAGTLDTLGSRVTRRSPEAVGQGPSGTSHSR